MAEPVAQTLSTVLKVQFDQTARVIKGCPENRRYHNVGEGKATPLWLVGHLANTTNFLGSMIGLGQPSDMPKEWNAIFSPSQFGGTPITTNPADYPSWDEAVEAYTRVMGNYVKGIAALKDADLEGACKGTVPPPLAAMVPNLGASIYVNIVHDGHHRGQMALLAAAP
jgi:hypothetical protein